MSKVVTRGHVPTDKKEFGKTFDEALQHAAEEIYYFLNRGYDIKSVSNFIGNHYMLSERQRMALVRMVSSEKDLKIRKEKELPFLEKGSTLHIDGFNTIITLEVALSQSLLLKGFDGTIRDLAGLRGNYRIVDKTEQALHILFQTLRETQVKEAHFYLDAPVSNSGRLKILLYDYMEEYEVKIQVDVIPNVDQILEKLDHVITSDAIILNKCASWYNLNGIILGNKIEQSWVYEISL